MSLNAKKQKVLSTFICIGKQYCLHLTPRVNHFVDVNKNRKVYMLNRIN